LEAVLLAGGSVEADPVGEVVVVVAEEDGGLQLESPPVKSIQQSIELVRVLLLGLSRRGSRLLLFKPFSNSRGANMCGGTTWSWGLLAPIRNPRWLEGCSR
jgi:hypothetical protein